MNSLDETFSALSDPTRRAILDRLSRGAASVTDLAAPFEMSLPAVSKHLKVLEEAGLLTRTREGRVHCMQLSAQPMARASQWIETYRPFWTEPTDLFEAHLEVGYNECFELF